MGSQIDPAYPALYRVYIFCLLVCSMVSLPKLNVRVPFIKFWRFFSEFRVFKFRMNACVCVYLCIYLMNVCFYM